TVETVPARIVAEGRISATLAVQSGGIYQVHLIGDETGFENSFSPKYEIHSLVDTAPRVDWVDLRNRSLLLPPDDILSLVGEAEDDLPLDQLEQRIRINEGEWTALPFQFESATKVRVERTWDLVNLKLQAGDLVTTKLVGTDRKGSEGESVPLTIVVAKTDFEPERHAQLELKATAYDAVFELADEAERALKSVIEIVRKAKGHDLEDVQQQLHFSKLLEHAETTERSAQNAVEQVVVTLSQMSSGVDAHELELASQCLAPIALVEMRKPKEFLAAAARARNARELAAELAKVEAAFGFSAGHVRVLERSLRKALTFNVTRAFGEDLRAIKDYQDDVASRRELTRERLLRHQRVAANLIRIVSEFGKRHIRHADGSVEGQLRSKIQWLERMRDQIEIAMEDGAEEKHLRRAFDNCRRDLEHQVKGPIPGNVASVGSDGRKQLHKINRPRGNTIRKIADARKRRDHAARVLMESRSDDRKWVAAQMNTELEIASLSVELPKADATFHEASPQSRTLQSSDARLVRRAVNAVASQPLITAGVPDESEEEKSPLRDVPKALRTIGTAYTRLETGHRIEAQLRLLQEFVDLERERPKTLGSLPRYWHTVKPRLHDEGKELARAGFSKELGQRLTKLTWGPDMQRIDDAMRRRRYHDPNYVNVSSRLQKLNRELENIVDEMQATMKVARETIASFLPLVSDLARQARDETKTLENETREVTEESTEKELLETREEIAELQTAEDELRKKLSDLFDALLDEANQDSLLTQEDIERSRDADDAMAMLKDIAQNLEETIDDAAESQSDESQSENLAKAAEEQKKAAETLEQIAEHFEKLEKGEDASESRKALREREAELALEQQLDERFAPAQEVADLAKTDANELLKQLERELAVNEEMRNALSDIAQNSVREAEETLREGEQAERDVRRDLDQSDNARRE
ncbi:MAG: hypothetical protein AAF517_20970, partial [Planctomycetota bacterium]